MEEKEEKEEEKEEERGVEKGARGEEGEGLGGGGVWRKKGECYLIN